MCFHVYITVEDNAFCYVLTEKQTKDNKQSIYVQISLFFPLKFPDNRRKKSLIPAFIIAHTSDETSTA